MNKNFVSEIASLLKREMGDKTDFVTEISSERIVPVKRKNICHIYFGSVEENSQSGERTVGIKLDIYLKKGTSGNEAFSLVKNITDTVSSHGMVISSVARYNPTIKNGFWFVPCEIKLRDYILPREYHISNDEESLFDAARLENINIDYLVRLSGAEELLKTGGAVRIREKG